MVKSNGNGGNKREKRGEGRIKRLGGEQAAVCLLCLALAASL